MVAIKKQPRKRRTRPKKRAVEKLQRIIEPKIQCPYCRSDQATKDRRNGSFIYCVCRLCCGSDGKPTRFKIISDRSLKYHLPTGSWKGQRCFIFGSSSISFDFSKIKPADKTIAINEAWELFRGARGPDISLSIDKIFWQSIKTIQAYWLQTSVRVTLDNLEAPNFVYTVPIAASDVLWSESLEQGFLSADCSEAVAMNLADCLGVRKVVLVGFSTLPAARARQIKQRIRCKVQVADQQTMLNKIFSFGGAES